MQQRQCDDFLETFPPSPLTSPFISAPFSPQYSYLLITTASGCEPTNRVYYVALDELPRDSQNVLDFASFDLRTGNKQLPIVKLVDNFDASYDYVANEGSVFTWLTNLSASRYRCDDWRFLVCGEDARISLRMRRLGIVLCVALIVL